MSTWFVFPLLLGTLNADGPVEIKPLSINRRWEVIQSPRTAVLQRRALAQAAADLNPEHTFVVAGVDVTPELLRELSQTPKDEPLVRALRERTRRPFDLMDFLLLLDDVLAADERMKANGIWIAGGRARSEGVLLHPDDVYKSRPRRYGLRNRELAVDKPARPAELEPAKNGDVLGPRWSARFENPRDQEALQAALNAEAPDFSQRVSSLLEQLKTQGAEVYLTSTVRKKERGYLMWGAFYLSRAESDAALRLRLRELNTLNTRWRLDIPIQWQHPTGLKETRESARLMAEAYDVVYATKRGACCSDHYNGSAVDFVALGLPRMLTLKAPDGAQKTFDLSVPSQPRDLSLTPEVVRWIETHFQFKKLLGDYPHWNDAKDH